MVVMEWPREWASGSAGESKKVNEVNDHNRNITPFMRLCCWYYVRSMVQKPWLIDYTGRRPFPFFHRRHRCCLCFCVFARTPFSEERFRFSKCSRYGCRMRDFSRSRSFWSAKVYFQVIDCYIWKWFLMNLYFWLWILYLWWIDCKIRIKLVRK